MKKGTRNIVTAVGIILLVLGGLWYFDVIEWNGTDNVKPKDVSSSSTTPAAPSSSLSGSCTVPLADAQILAISAVDADKPGTAVSGIATTVFDDENAPVILATNQTAAGGSYTVLTSKSGFLKGYTTVTTSCTETDPLVQLKMKAYDSAPTVTVYNPGSYTANAVNTVNATLTASSPVTFDVRLTPSALYKHIAGGVPAGQATGSFMVFTNFTNSSDWDLSGFSASTYGGFAPLPCTPYSGPTPQVTGVFLKGFICTADFTGKDAASNYGISLTVKPSSIYANGAKTVLSVGIVPVEYYQHTITGALSTGPVKDDGSAIQTPIMKGIGIA